MRHWQWNRRVLICDEATSSLDVTIETDHGAFWKSWKDTHGLSFIFICHNLALVQSFCDKCWLYDGKVVESRSRMISMSRRGVQKLVDAVFGKISTEESPAGQDYCDEELPFEATRRSRRILQARIFS